MLYDSFKYLESWIFLLGQLKFGLIFIKLACIHWGLLYAYIKTSSMLGFHFFPMFFVAGH